MADQEVYFHEWCSKCKYRDLAERELPCNDCLAEPSNEDSHKPVYFKEADDE